MRTLKLHFDGWIHIPADLLARLGGGERIEVRRVEGGLFVGPAGLGPALEPEPAGEGAAEGRGLSGPPPAEAEVVRRRRGRPRKVTAVQAVAVMPSDDGGAASGSAVDVEAERRSSLPPSMRPLHSARGRRAVGVQATSRRGASEAGRQG